MFDKIIMWGLIIFSLIIILFAKGIGDFEARLYILVFTLPPILALYFESKVEKSSDKISDSASDFMDKVFKKAGVTVLGGVIGAMVLNFFGIEGNSLIIGSIIIGSINFIVV